MQLRTSLWIFLVITMQLSKADAESGLPVREVTVFKDGHALVTHHGELKTDADGNAVIDHVPTPVIGTFWAHSGNKKATLRSLTSTTSKNNKTRTATSTRELLEANVGTRVLVRDHDKSEYAATIVRAKRDEAVVLLKTDHGTKVVKADSIGEVTFLEDPGMEVVDEVAAQQLRLQLDWGARKPDANTEVGMSYLQRGIRWIPNYRLHLKDDGTVRVQLQATLLNEMIDLNDVTLNLLVGVPTFEFKGTVDPIAAQQAVEQLSAFFANPNASGNRPTANHIQSQIMLSNQVSRMSEFAPANRQAAADLGPDIKGAGGAEDLFVYTVEHVTLAKGDRMIVHVGEWGMQYEDIYRLELAATPPMEVRRQFSSNQQREIAQLHSAPKAKHLIRITNNSDVPLTTAPALIVSDKSVLGQGMMTFASPGSRVDVGLTTAVNISVAHKEDQVSAKEVRLEDGRNYLRFEYKGQIRLGNFHKEPIKVEVVRNTLGEIHSAGKGAKISKPSAWTMDSRDVPQWWRWYSWPSWWHLRNSRGRAEWAMEIKAGDTVEMPYEWHYLWRL